VSGQLYAPAALPPGTHWAITHSHSTLLFHAPHRSVLWECWSGMHVGSTGRV